MRKENCFTTNDTDYLLYIIGFFCIFYPLFKKSYDIILFGIGFCIVLLAFFSKYINPTNLEYIETNICRILKKKCYNYEKSGGIIYVTRTNVTFKLYLLNHTTESFLI